LEVTSLQFEKFRELKRQRELLETIASALKASKVPMKEKIKEPEDTN